MKQIGMQNEDRRQTALLMLVEGGVLEECENHDGTYFEGDPEELPGVCERANALISNGESPFGKMTRREVTDLIKEVYEDNSGLDHCQEEGCLVLAGIDTD